MSERAGSRMVLVVACLWATSCGGGGAGTPDASDADGEAGADADAEAGADADAEPDAEPDLELEDADGDEAEDAGDAGAGDCTGLPDFTSCTVVTSPDRDYDICVGGLCVSPGCGDPSCTPPGPGFTLADTGQRSCFSGSAAIACPVGSCTGSCGQDALHGWDVDHTMDDRFERSEPIAGQPVVLDRVTGLAWQGCSRGLSGSLCATGAVEEVLWADALAYCDELVWGGFDDWHLPDVLEGHSIMDYGVAAAVTASAFPNVPPVRHFTSTSWAGGPDAVWIAPFSGVDGKLGVITPVSIEASSGAARCVRSAVELAYPATPRARDTGEPGQPVVVDHVLGRSFQGCARGQTGDDCAGGASDPGSWTEALAYCDGLVWGGLDDWRLPDVKELRAMIDSSRTGPALDPLLYPNAPDLPAWTSTTDAADPSRAWSVTVGFGGGIQEGGKVAELTIRCVR